MSAKPKGAARVITVSWCATCTEPGPEMRPPHEASATCESGHHIHCTCARCF